MGQHSGTSLNITNQIMMSQNDIHRIIVFYLWIGARIRFATEESFALFIPISMAEDFGCRGIFNAEKARRQQHQFIVIVDRHVFSLWILFYDNWSTNQGHWCGLCEELWRFSLTGDCDVDTMAPSMAPDLQSGCAPMPAIWDDQVQI